MFPELEVTFDAICCHRFGVGGHIEGLAVLRCVKDRRANLIHILSTLWKKPNEAVVFGLCFQWQRDRQSVLLPHARNALIRRLDCQVLWIWRPISFCVRSMSCEQKGHWSPDKPLRESRSIAQKWWHLRNAKAPFNLSHPLPILGTRQTKVTTPNRFDSTLPVYSVNDIIPLFLLSEPENI